MVRWHELAWPEVRAAVAATPFVVLPFGAIEEHGPHLTLGTDAVAATELATRLADRAGLIELPTMPYGQVWSLAHFDGSLSISDDTLVRLVVEIADGLGRVGVRGIVLLSAHLGNAAPLKRAARALEEAGGVPALVLTYPGLAAVAGRIQESARSHPSIMHADELETSILLELDPEQVRMDRAVSEYPEYPDHFEHAAERWSGLSESGVFGDATRATPEKGAAIVEHVIDTAADIVASWKSGLA